MGSRWGCILLLDEADVFLAARAPQDFTRNGLVAVFLRVLGYYAGILFLTTNRVRDFDEAFVSRVHISLFYLELDLGPTRDIFKLSLKLIQKRFEKKGSSVDIDHDEILKFAEKYHAENKKMRWNGRQIRNGCQTALALAEFDAQGGSYERIYDVHAEVKLQVGHLETVSKAYLDFMSYLGKLYGKDAERRANAIGIRFNDVGLRQTSVASAPGNAAQMQPQPSFAASPAYVHATTGQSFPQYNYSSQPTPAQQHPAPDPNAYTQMQG